jgi:S1-C subfamily serine protease
MNKNIPYETLVSLSDAIMNVYEKVASSIVSVQSETSGIGSGVVWDTNGYIVTCSHIIKRLDEIEVGLNDMRTIPAKVIGNDPHSDVALLKIEKMDSTLKPIEIIDTENLKAGQFVLALANPYGDHPSITQGIITSSRNSIRGLEGRTMDNVVITDTRLNPGYSGGPLIDVEGRMIGLNIAYISSRGIAIRVSKVKSIVDKLAEHGKIKRAFLGIVSNTISIPEEVAKEQLGRTQDNGLIVLSVGKNTPAKKAGLLLGDVIIKFAKEPVNSLYDLEKLLTQEVIGKSIELTILRGEKLIELTITPGELS